MKEPEWLLRVVEYFSNRTEELEGEFVLPSIDLATLQRLWAAPHDQPMVECFPIEEGQAQFFRELAGIEFDFTHYSYFLTAYTTDWNATKGEGGYMGLFPPPRDLPAFPETRSIIPKSAV